MAVAARWSRSTTTSSYSENSYLPSWSATTDHAQNFPSDGFPLSGDSPQPVHHSPRATSQNSLVFPSAHSPPHAPRESALHRFDPSSFAASPDPPLLRTPSAPRHSSSSTATHILDTPPAIPVSLDSIEIVSAPVADVGTMDALVDGMNNFDPDDIFSSSLQHHELRSKSKPKSKHHRIHPPLPSPPPGIVLQSATTSSRSPSRIPRPKHNIRNSPPSYSVVTPKSSSNVSTPSSSRPHSTKVVKDISIVPEKLSRFMLPPPVPVDKSNVKPDIPSISEIIRLHGPSCNQKNATNSFIHDSDDLVSRSSIDTIAEEVQRTLRQPLPDSIVSGDHSPRDPISPKTPSNHLPKNRTSLPNTSFDFNPGPLSQAEAIATYLKSVRLTRLIKIPRTLQPPLQVSLSDLGDPNGRPLVVFLGLGSVRYLMGLYDEMAEILGLRLITIDRWGLGRTSAEPNASKGVREWARVVIDILARLGIDHYSIMAHSAGAPYAMSLANLRPECVKGDICLLAPWVGARENASYKWLKYVPNGLLKTAQAAEWRMQTWMLGKPPTVNYRGIGYDPRQDAATPSVHRSLPPHATNFYDDQSTQRESRIPGMSEESLQPDDYDDLADFEGQFGSRTTLDSSLTPRPATTQSELGHNGSSSPSKKKGIFGGILRTGSMQRKESAHTIRTEKGARLRNLRSVGSLKGSSKSGVAPSIASRATTITSPALPSIGLGLGEFPWAVMNEVEAMPPLHPSYQPPRRSVSLSTKPNSVKSMPTTQRSTASESARSASNKKQSSTVKYQAALANALLAASHAESSRGVHSDLVQILNHEGKSWGFSYSNYPHRVRVWYGDKDDRIAESDVRWMEKNMPAGYCEVKIVKGADHGLMYRSGVVVEVLEAARSFWS